MTRKQLQEELRDAQARVDRAVVRGEPDEVIEALRRARDETSRRLTERRSQ